MGYSDIELIEFIEQVNELEPYCLSIVDTFGSMFQEDLHRVFEIINHNLISTCKIGFHSHNNMQLSNALSQEFIRLSYGKRNVVVDGTISGMGRGAGNTPTELIAQYMVTQLGYNYDMDALLDIIDEYMDNIRTRCSWGYTTPFFVAGCYSAHVNNITYLVKKNSIRSKDIRYILNKIGALPRKRYNYDLLEKTYVDYLKSDIDDNPSINKLQDVISHKKVLIIAPGNSISIQSDRVKSFIEKESPIVIAVNFVPEGFAFDYIYMSNARRFNYWKDVKEFADSNKIITSNLTTDLIDKKTVIISFNRLIKCGWENIDNSMLMLLRLLDCFELQSINLAGFDGYRQTSYQKNNYVSNEMELYNVTENPILINKEIASMLCDFKETRKHNTPIKFITDSRFDGIIE